MGDYGHGACASRSPWTPKYEAVMTWNGGRGRWRPLARHGAAVCLRPIVGFPRHPKADVRRFNPHREQEPQEAATAKQARRLMRQTEKGLQLALPD